MDINFWWLVIGGEWRVVNGMEQLTMSTETLGYN